MPSNFVLTSLKASTYEKRWQKTYPLACDRSERVKRSLVCTSSPLHLLRPRWKVILNILWEMGGALCSSRSLRFGD